MRLSAFVPVTLVIVAIAPSSLAAQPVPPPVIHRITLQSETGVLAIAGSGLGGDLVVALDGQPVTVLPGATDVQMKVQAPAAVLTAPGTYRLTVVDLARQVGDGFVVVIPAGPVLAASGSLAEASGGDGTAAPVSHDGARAAPTGRRRPRAVTACRRR